MRHLRLILGIGVATFAMVAFMTITSWAAEDIRNSKHNLSASRNTTGTYPDGTLIGDKVMFSDTTEVCIFCHTPHGGAIVAGGAAPLWNRTPLTNKTGYTMYDSPNFDVKPLAPLGVSLACLSCHDGTVAFDSLINTPGSGTSITAGRAGWSGSGEYYDAANGTFNVAAQPYPNIGEPSAGVVNLSNDHPISMAIPCVTDPQFKDLCDNSSAAAAGVTLLKRDSSYNGAITQLADKRNNIRAYPTGGDGTRYIECASCHNPHEATSSRFLRYPSIGDGLTAKVSLPSGITASDLDKNRNAGSLLCLSCHQK